MTRTHPAVAFAALLLLTGCASRSSMPVPPPLLLDLLEGIPGSAEDDARPLEEAAGELERRFERARQQYDAGEYQTAAETFMEAARAGRGYDALAVNRASSYRNAAKAWYMAGVLKEKRALLEDQAREDPRCAAEIERVLAILGE